MVQAAKNNDQKHTLFPKEKDKLISQKLLVNSTIFLIQKRFAISLSINSKAIKALQLHQSPSSSTKIFLSQGNRGDNLPSRYKYLEGLKGLSQNKLGHYR